MSHRSSYPPSVLMDIASNSDSDGFSDSETDFDLPDSSPFHFPIPEYTHRRLSGYDPNLSLQRRFEQDLAANKIPNQNVLIDIINRPELYTAQNLPEHLHQTFNNLMELTRDEAMGYLGRNASVFSSGDKDLLEKQLQSAFSAKKFADDTLQTYFERIDGEEFGLNTILLPGNLDDPLAWAALPIQERSMDDPTSLYSKTTAMQSALLNKGDMSQAVPNLALIQTANPFHYATLSSSDDTLSALSALSDDDEFVAKVKAIEGRTATTLEEFTKNQQELRQLITTQQYTSMISDFSNDIITLQQQLEQNTKTPQLKASMTSDNQILSAIPEITDTQPLLPSERHQIMIDLAHLRYQKSHLEQHYKQKARQGGKLWSSSMGETTYDTEVSADYGSGADTSENSDSAEPKSTKNSTYSYWSYLNPWAYGNTQSSPTDDSESDSASATDTDNETNRNKDNKGGDKSIQDPSDQIFVFPGGYDAQLANRDYLHLDIANLSQKDQDVLKYRELLEDFVFLFFSSPSFTSQFWDQTDINRFIALYNNQEDSKWNVYAQLLQAWYANQFPSILASNQPATGDGSNDESNQRHPDNFQNNGITAATWDHLSPELKDFKMNMDLEFLGLCKQYFLQRSDIEKALTSHRDQFAPLFDDEIRIETGEVLSKLTYLVETQHADTRGESPSVVEDELKAILKQGKLPSIDGFTALTYFNQLSSGETMSLPNRFQCIKEFMIHLFNTHRLQDDYRLLVDIDMSGLYSAFHRESGGNKQQKGTKNGLQFIFLDPYKHTATIDLPLNTTSDLLTTNNNNTGSQQFHLCSSPSSSLFFDPNVQQRVMHWSQKPWASSIISQRQQFLEAAGISNHALRITKDAKTAPAHVLPGEVGYVEAQTRRLNDIQVNLNLPITQLPPSIQKRLDQSSSGEPTADKAVSSPQLNDLWEEDKQTINLYILAQQQQQLQNDGLFHKTLFNKSLSHSHNQFFTTLFGLEHILQYEHSLSDQPQRKQDKLTDQGAANIMTPARAILISKKQVQMYQYLKHTLTQDVMKIITQYPHLQYLPINSPLAFVKGSLLPRPSPLLSLDPNLTYSLLSKEISPSTQTQNRFSRKLNRLTRLFQHHLVANPALIPTTLKFFSQVKQSREKAHLIEKEILKPNSTHTKLAALLQRSLSNTNSGNPNINPQLIKIKQNISNLLQSSSHSTTIIPPILDNPVQPHPNDFRAVLLFDSLDPEFRAIYHTPRRTPRTPFTEGQTPEYSRPGFARHPFNRAYVRTGDTNGDIYSYLGTSTPDVPITPLERQEKYLQWCRTFPEQAFNRQLVDILKDHTFIASQPAVQQYLNRRIEYYFHTKIPEQENGDEQLASSTNESSHLSPHDPQYNNLGFIASPDELELLSLPPDFFPQDILTHPHFKPYLHHQIQLYRSRYELAREIVEKEIKTQQNRARAKYLNQFKDELGLSERDLKVFTNDIHDGDHPTNESTQSAPTLLSNWFDSTINAVRNTLGLPDRNKDGFIDTSQMNQPQWPFIFGIPLEIQDKINEQVRPKASEVVYLDNILPTQYGDTRLPLLKPQFIVTSRTPLQTLSDPSKVIHLDRNRLNLEDERSSNDDDRISNQPLYTESFKREEKVFKVGVAPYPPPDYIQRLSYYDQSYYLFGLSPYEADKELAEKYAQNKDYLAKMHAASEFNLTYLQYLAYLDSLTLAAQAEAPSNISLQERKFELEHLIMEQNYQLSQRISQRKFAQQQEQRKEEQSNTQHNKLLQNSRSNSPDLITNASMGFHSDPNRPELGDEDYLDSNDLAAVRYRDGLIEELESLPLMSPSGVNLAALKTSLQEQLLLESFDPVSGANPHTFDANLVAQIMEGKDVNPSSSISVTNLEQFESDKQFQLMIDDIFKSIHGSPICLESISKIPTIVSTPVTDEFTGEEYLEYYELRLTISGEQVWKELHFDQITGDLIGDSVESLSDLTYVMEELQPDGVSTTEKVVTLRPRQFVNVYDVIPGGFTSHQHDDSIGAGGGLNTRLEKVTSFLTTPLGEPIPIAKPVSKEAQHIADTQIANVLFIDEEHKDRQMRLAQQLRRDLPLQFEHEFSDDPYLADLFEKEFGQMFREGVWKDQDERLRRDWARDHPNATTTEELLIPDHRYDIYFRGDYRDYIIRPEDSEELQQEKIKRRRLAVRDLPSPISRQIVPEDFLLAPRALANNVTLEFTYNFDDYTQMLKRKQVEKQTRFELYRRDQEAKKEREAEERRKRLMQQQQEAYSRGFDMNSQSPQSWDARRGSPQPNKSENKPSLDSQLLDEQFELREFFASNPHLAHLLQAHPDHYYSILTSYISNLAEKGADGEESIPTLFSNLFSLPHTDDNGGYKFGQLHPSINPTTSHLYNTLFQHNASAEETSSRLAKLSEKAEKKAQEVMKQELLQRNRALLLMGVDPKQFEAQFQHQVYNDVLFEEVDNQVSRVNLNDSTDPRDLETISDDFDNLDELDKEILRHQKVSQKLSTSVPDGMDIYNIVFDLSDTPLLDLQSRLTRQNQYRNYLNKSDPTASHIFGPPDYSRTSFQSPSYTPHSVFDPAVSATLTNPAMSAYQTQTSRRVSPKYNSQETVYHKAIVNPDRRVLSLSQESDSTFLADPAIQFITHADVSKMKYTPPVKQLYLQTQIVLEDGNAPQSDPSQFTPEIFDSFGLLG